MRALLVCSTALFATLLAVSPQVASAQMKLSPKATAPGGTETRYFTSIDGAALGLGMPQDAQSGGLFVLEGLGVRGVTEPRFAG